ncbi:hypothetical protein GCM10023220_30390 [Streptomyces ziwulingensis]|uniref:Uncharacterized protein n=1 Tax=Streptomyces ziwulingensis TaxID=1045501 RepID=A0ABP9BSR7_9ACTN
MQALTFRGPSVLAAGESIDRHTTVTGPEAHAKETWIFRAGYGLMLVTVVGPEIGLGTQSARHLISARSRCLAITP